MTVKSVYKQFWDALEKMDKPRCVDLALQALEQGSMDIESLYTRILAPALNSMTTKEDELQVAIWKEHVRSSIVRTIIECCYPFVLKEIRQKGILPDKGKVVIFSPPEEYHELGARMGADFFNLCGYQTLYVGSNTPKADLMHGIQVEKPNYVVIHAMNFYNLFNVKKIIEEMKTAFPAVKIFVSGYAFIHDVNMSRNLGAIAVIDSVADILALEGGQA